MAAFFPLNAAHRAEIDHTHINLVRLVMKHGSEPDASGSVQLSFLDFYLGVIRTETLSSVYEQFLENLEQGERRRSGAFYTPPFIVDFMLDRLEEEIALTDGVKVLDPAAGSGVFLVGAYRRIIERFRLTAPHQALNIKDVKGLLTRNIFAVERNVDACNVAAFSLYLTMLDYVDPRDLTRVAAGEDPEKLFPPVVGHNILHADFFEDGGKIDLPMVSCVIGNPPWQTVQKLQSKAAIDWQIKNSQMAPIGNGQVAELFVWKVLFEHLEEGGYLGFLIPSKSFVNPTSWKFRKELARRYTIVGAANFAHFRHRLFAKAKHPGIAAFFRKSATPPRHQCWIYSPLSTSQPVAAKKRPWTIIFDRADVQHVRQERLARDPRGWFDALVLHPIDRQIKMFVRDQVELEKISTFETLSFRVGAGISRGGSPSETGIEKHYLLDAPDGRFDGTGDNPVSSGTQGSLFHDEMILLPPEQLSRVAPSYAQKFSGNILLVPRNMKSVRVVLEPVGFTSSSMAFFFKKPAKDVSEREVKLLAAAGRYLTSQLGLYMIATTGRRWMLDRRNLEPEDLKALAVPISGLDDPRIDGILAEKADTLDTYLMNLLGLTEEMQKAVYEFIGFRMGFQDGDIPNEALTLPKPGGLDCYMDTVIEQLASLSGRNNAFAVDYLDAPESGVGALAVHYLGTVEPPPDLAAACSSAIEIYFGDSGNAFTDSLSLRANNQKSIVTVVKPLEYYRWTIDSAVADSQKIFSAFMAQ
ncbi:HsdM family class I SAM-dependent methyltransferase [Limimaricola cinnabarinus]|uniref:site-specific DNA-methyltransferase (adenine-specific) n=1 Tax=Limimaricola cinnabarinus LL-001 TaxID=1337093 RepID=U2Z6R8_9RHOB|nr:N-6 DNA methylase [Limimaricola cinnabarinus]GAD57120.1 type I restriction-modification system, M subunit, putative [Limimaricola cinnabarinus LL-001]